MDEIISRMFANPYYSSLEFVTARFEDGHYFQAGQTLVTHCCKEDIPTFHHNADFKIIGRHYLEIALLSGIVSLLVGPWLAVHSLRSVRQIASGIRRTASNRWASCIL